MECYQVIFVDEYDNFYELGYYADLKLAEPDINKQLENYRLSDFDEEHPGEIPQFGEGKSLGRLEAYPGTFSKCFDRIIDVDEGCIQVRGFVKDTDDILADIKQLTGEANG